MLRNDSREKEEPQAPARVPLTNAQRQAKHRARVRAAVNRMKRIVTAVERLNSLMLDCAENEISIPTNLFARDVETTLENLTNFVQAQNFKRKSHGGKPAKVRAKKTLF